MTGISSFTVKPPESIIYSCQGKFLSESEVSVVLVKPHSVELLTEDYQVDLEVSLFASIIGGSIFPSGLIDNLALVSSDFSLIILSFENSQIHPIVSSELRHDSVVPSEFAPIFSASVNSLIICIYPNSFYRVSGTQILEIYIGVCKPNSMRILDNSVLFVDNRQNRLCLLPDFNHLSKPENPFHPSLKLFQ